MHAALCAAELVVLDGPDAAAFAHSQFCNDVKLLAVDTWQWNAWLDPQGRVRCFFALLRVQPSRLIAWFPLGDATPVRELLARYVMRSALNIDIATWALHTLDGSALPHTIEPHQVAPYGGGYVLAQPGNNRYAWIAPSASAPFDPTVLNEWRLADIDAGLPLLAPENRGEFVAQALALERVAAIRFDKGCYPGQEIAARLHFLGGNKRNVRRVSVDGELPPPGSTIVDSSHATVGRVLYSATHTGQDSKALAVLTAVPDDASLFTRNSSPVSLLL